MKHLKSALLVAGLCLVLTGCFRLEQRIKVDGDDSVQLNQIFAGDLSALDGPALGLPEGSLSGAEANEFCQGLREGAKSVNNDLPGAVAMEVKDYKDGDFCGVEFRSKLASAPDHSSELTQILEQPTRLVKTAEGWFFETTVSPQQLAGEAGLSGDQMRQAFDSGKILLVVELPGQPIQGQHNATKVSGSTLTWEIDPLAPQGRLYASSEPATGLAALPVSPKVLAVIGVNLAVLAGLAWFFLRPEKQAAVAVQDAPAGMGSAMASTAAVAAAAAPGTPYFDDTYGIWMLDDPARGMLWHREATDEWVPFT